MRGWPVLAQWRTRCRDARWLTGQPAGILATVMTEPGSGPIMLYDGDCGMCSAIVQFVLKREASPAFRFVALQSDEGRHLSGRYGVPDDMSTAAVIHDDSALLRSDAVLFAFRLLRQPWRTVGTLTWIPRPVRDAVYRVIARYRRLLGPPRSCVLPDAATRGRFGGGDAN